MHLIIDTVSTPYPMSAHSELVQEKVQLFDFLLCHLGMEVQCLHSKYGNWRTTQIITSPDAYQFLSEYIEAVGELN